jgi:hypothetical protein
VAVDMARVVEWEDMAEARVDIKLSQVHYIVPSLVHILVLWVCCMHSYCRLEKEPGKYRSD